MGKQRQRPELPWVAPFLAELAASGIMRRACRAAKVDTGSVYPHRKRNPLFAAAWEESLRQARSVAEKGEGHAGEPPEKRRQKPRAKPRKKINANWPPMFLGALADSSCVRTAAATAGIEPGRAHRRRRDNPKFAAEWRAALAEGYDHLEMEMLAALRGQDGARKMDLPNAVRLLTAHRKTMAEIRAAQEPDDEQAVLASIDEMIDRMRREVEAEAGNEATEQAEGGDDDARS